MSEREVTDAGAPCLCGCPFFIETDRATPGPPVAKLWDDGIWSCGPREKLVLRACLNPECGRTARRLYAFGHLVEATTEGAS